MLILLHVRIFPTFVSVDMPVCDELIAGSVFGFFPYDTILFPWIGLTFFVGCLFRCVMGLEHMMITGLDLNKLA
jgi:cytochrome b subunit of formate dehydrogenase